MAYNYSAVGLLKSREQHCSYHCEVLLKGYSQVEAMDFMCSYHIDYWHRSTKIKCYIHSKHSTFSHIVPAKKKDSTGGEKTPQSANDNYIKAKLQLKSNSTFKSLFTKGTLTKGPSYHLPSTIAEQTDHNKLPQYRLGDLQNFTSTYVMPLGDSIVSLNAAPKNFKI